MGLRRRCPVSGPHCCRIVGFPLLLSESVWLDDLGDALTDVATVVSFVSGWLGNTSGSSTKNWLNVGGSGSRRDAQMKPPNCPNGRDL